MRNATDTNVLHYSKRQRVADVEVAAVVRCEVPFCTSDAGIGLREPVSLAFTASCYPNGSNASGPFAWPEVPATCPATRNDGKKRRRKLAERAQLGYGRAEGGRR
jgi:hypothetical protein